MRRAARDIAAIVLMCLAAPVVAIFALAAVLLWASAAIGSAAADRVIR
jgi:hypothetical protein